MSETTSEIGESGQIYQPNNLQKRIYGVELSVVRPKWKLGFTAPSTTDLTITPEAM
jgi:hypothetical protein